MFLGVGPVLGVVATINFAIVGGISPSSTHRAGVIPVRRRGSLSASDLLSIFSSSHDISIVTHGGTRSRQLLGLASVVNPSRQMYKVLIPHPTLGSVLVNSDSCVKLGGAFLEFGTVYIAGKSEGSMTCMLEAHRLIPS